MNYAFRIDCLLGGSDGDWLYYDGDLSFKYQGESYLQKY
jgi:hypothetical protein